MTGDGEVTNGRGGTSHDNGVNRKERMNVQLKETGEFNIKLPHPIGFCKMYAFKDISNLNLLTS